MYERIAKIERAFLGVEGHGIFTAMLTVSYGSSGQGVGGYSLDAPQEDEDGKHLGRVGTAFGMEWIARAMRACGVNDWCALKGRTIIVLKESDNWNAQPVGIKPLPTERGETFIFADLAAEHFGVVA